MSNAKDETNYYVLSAVFISVLTVGDIIFTEKKNLWSNSEMIRALTVDVTPPGFHFPIFIVIYYIADKQIKHVEL